MVTTNRNIKCRTIDDLLEVLKSEASEEDKIKCLRDIGITDIDKYKEYIENLENSIKEKEKRKKELEHILELEENKKKYLKISPIALGFGTSLIYFAYKSYEASIGTLLRCYPCDDLSMIGVVGKFFGLSALGWLLALGGIISFNYAYKNIKNYIETKHIERERGQINIEKLREELSELEKDLNKNKNLYNLLKERHNKIF